MLSLCAVYLLLDSGLPVAQVTGAPRVVSELSAGRGFVIEYSVVKRRRCPGNIDVYLVGQGDVPVYIPITREPVGTFLRSGDPERFRMQPYVPRYVRPGLYVVRTVVSYTCGAWARQQDIMDTVPVMIGPRAAKRAAPSDDTTEDAS